MINRERLNGPIPERVPPWKVLWDKSQYTPLNDAVEEIVGVRLHDLNPLQQELNEAGIRIWARRRGKAHYYYLPLSEKNLLEEHMRSTASERVPPWNVLTDTNQFGHLSDIISARGLDRYYESLRQEGFKLFHRSRGGENYYYYPRSQEEPLKTVLGELGVLREDRREQNEDVKLDSVLARRILTFVVEGNLESYPYSSISELCAALNFYLLHFISSDKLPKIEPGTASEFYQYFAYGLQKLEVEARDPKIRGEWDEDTKNLWEKLQDMKRKYGSKGLLLIRTLNRLEQSERILVQTSRQLENPGSH